MVSAHSHDLREQVVYSYLQGETMRAVTETFKVFLGFIHNITDLYQRYRQVVDPYSTPCCGHHILTAADEDYIHSLTKAWPSTYLNEIQQELDSECGVFILLAMISHTLMLLRAEGLSPDSRGFQE